ncbi:hypothetical protein AAHE18_18G020900 [Arachis hypogaea]
MCLLRAVDLPNVNLCCLLVTQCLQNGKFTDLSPRMRLRSTRIFKPRSDMWPSLQCHIIVISSWLDEATDASASCKVSPTSMYRFAAIFSAFITTRAPLTTFKIPPSIWVLHPSSSNCPIDNKFFFKPFTCLTP